MKFPVGTGFDLTSGLVITVVLDDYVLTGTFLGKVEERSCHDEQPIYVNVEEEAEFIFLQLTCALVDEGVLELPIGTIIAINVRKILFLAPNGTCAEM